MSITPIASSKRSLDEDAHELRLVLRRAGRVVHRRGVLGGVLARLASSSGSSSSAGMPVSTLLGGGRAHRLSRRPTRPRRAPPPRRRPRRGRGTRRSPSAARGTANFACATPRARRRRRDADGRQHLPLAEARLVRADDEVAESVRAATARPPRRHSTSASSARRNVAGSECGSEKQRLPPSVPTSRTRRFATCRSIAASAGSRSRTSGERSSSRCVTVAPTTRHAVLRADARELLDRLQVDEVAERRRSRA